MVYRFCYALNSKLAGMLKGRFCPTTRAFVALNDGALVYIFDDALAPLHNAAFLLAAFCVVELGKTPHEAVAPFTGRLAPFAMEPFCDWTGSATAWGGLSLIDYMTVLDKVLDYR